jgi:hypothetical protein
MHNRFSCLPYLIGTLLLLTSSSCSKKTTPQSQPAATIQPTTFSAPPLLTSESLPLSEIDIPVTIALQPFYAMAERSIQKEYTSVGFPNDFVVDDCSTRYMYRFHRGPIQFRGEKNVIGMAFPGYYMIAGAQRICTGTGSDRSSVSPWSPTCTCGVKEAERRVNVAFGLSLGMSNDYRLQPLFSSINPIAVDKCTMCFWGQDVTQTVMTQLKIQLDDAGRQTADSLRKLDMRPRFQQVWDQLNQIQPLFGMGWLQLNPERLRLSRFNVSRDTLRMTMGLSARPVITQDMPQMVRTVVPDLSDRQEHNGFRIIFDARLRYDSLSAMATQRLKDKRIEIESVNRHVFIRQVDISGSESGRLGIKVRFDGSADGSFYLTGVPAYDSATKLLRFKELEYDIRSTNVTVNTAKWLFSRKILNVLEQNTRFELAPYEQQVIDMINPQLNRELKKGVVLSGKLREIDIPSIHAGKDVLTVRCLSQGELSLLVKELPL